MASAICEERGMSSLRRIQEEWKRFLEKPFPKESSTQDPHEICLLSVDTAAAGCLSSFASNGELDKNRIDVLKSCTEDIQSALPELNGYTKDYFSNLKELCVSVLKETRLSK